MDSGFDEKKLRRIHRRFFVSARRIHQEDGQLIADLDQDSAHHIRTVLRIGAGAKIVLFDGSGKEYLAEIMESKPSRIRTKILETKSPETESGLELTLAQAIIKEQAFDKILTSATELGIKKIIPILCKRVVVKINSRDIDQKLFRWSKILEEAASLSGRVKVPRIDYPVELSKLLLEKFDGTKIIMWEKAQGGELERMRNEKREIVRADPGVCPMRNEKRETRNILLLVGPEGGFEDQEAEAAIAAGFVPLGLGPRILRAETAPIAAISILQYLFGDLS